MITLVVVLISAVSGLGVLLIVQGLRGYDVLPKATTKSPVSLPLFAAALLAGIAVYTATGWPVAAVITALVVGASPKLFGGKQHSERVRQRSDAVAIFTEQIRDNMYTASGVTQAILDAASDPPEAIADELGTFIHRVRRNDNTVEALQQLGRDLDNPFSDMVIVVLSTAVIHSTDQTAPTISRLAETIREDQKWKLRIEVARAQIRTASKMITATFVVVAIYLYLVSPELLAAYDSFIGQVWLLVVAAMFAGGATLIGQLSKVATPARFKARQRVEGVAIS